MLQIYLYKPEGCIMDNHEYFGHVTFQQMLNSKKKSVIEAIMRDVDGCFEVDFEAGTVSNKFGRDHDIMDLSMGCKTLLNVYLNPDTPFYAQEIGDNATKLLLAMNGSIYIDWLFPETNISEDWLYGFHKSPTEYKELTYEEGVNEYACY